MRVSIFWKESSACWYLIWTDPISGGRKSKSTRTKIRRDAEREATRHEKLLDESGGISAIGWGEFRIRFEDERLPMLKKTTRENYHHALNKFERLIGNPKNLGDINSSLLSKYQAKMRDAKLRPASIASNLRFLRSALSWAHKLGMIARVPPVVMPSLISRRGRAVTMFEFIRLLIAIKRNEPNPQPLIDLAKGLWLSGLRISEALLLDFEKGPIQLRLDQKRPVIDFHDQKSGKSELMPITPDFATFLRRESCRKGRVFKVGFDVSTIGKRFSDHGKTSGVRVSDTKFVSAHDLRRTFGQRWALRVHPLVLQKLMRHAAIETTLKYYVHLDTDSISDQLWSAVEGQQITQQPAPRNDIDSTSRTKKPR